MNSKHLDKTRDKIYGQKEKNRFFLNPIKPHWPQILNSYESHKTFILYCS